MAHHYFLSWSLSTFQGVSTCSGKAVLFTTIGFFTNSFNFIEAVLYHRYFLTETIHLYHLFEIFSENIVVVLCVFCIFCHRIEIKLIMMVLPEELFLYFFIMWSLLCLFLKNPLDLVLIGVVFVDVPFIIWAKFIHTSMKVTGRDNIALIILTHTHFIDRYLFTIFISDKNSQFNCFTEL